MQVSTTSSTYSIQYRMLTVACLRLAEPHAFSFSSSIEIKIFTIKLGMQFYIEPIDADARERSSV